MHFEIPEGKEEDTGNSHWFRVRLESGKTHVGVKCHPPHPLNMQVERQDAKYSEGQWSVVKGVERNCVEAPCTSSSLLPATGG